MIGEGGSQVPVAENGNGREERGQGKEGHSRQTRDSTRPPGVGERERVYPWDWGNTGISTPGERERIETKTAQVAQGPRGVGQAHAQVTAGALPGPSPSWNT